MQGLLFLLNHVYSGGHESRKATLPQSASAARTAARPAKAPLTVVDAAEFSSPVAEPLAAVLVWDPVADDRAELAALVAEAAPEDNDDAAEDNDDAALDAAPDAADEAELARDEKALLALVALAGVDSVAPAWEHSCAAAVAADCTVSASHVDCTQDETELTKVSLLHRQAVSEGSQSAVFASERQDTRQSGTSWRFCRPASAPCERARVVRAATVEKRMVKACKMRAGGKN